MFLKFEVNQFVVKKSGKPFKSGSKVQVIKGFTVNPHTGNPAMTFYLDDSIVDVKCCLPYFVGLCSRCGTFPSISKLQSERNHHLICICNKPLTFVEPQHIDSDPFKINLK